MPAEIRAAAMGTFNHLFALEREQSANGDWQPKRVILDADAKAVFVDFYNAVGMDAANADDREEAAWHKLTGYGARLALLGELARHDTGYVSGSVMQAATELARWFGAESKRIYTMLAEAPETASLRRLCEFINRHSGVVTARDVVTYYRPLRNQTGQAEAQLTQLVRSGLGEWVQISPSTNGGRPTRQFRLFAGSTECLRLQNPRILLETKGCADADKGDPVQNSVSPEQEKLPELAEADLI